MTSTPASEALNAFLVVAPTHSNKRVKRSNMDSPASDSSAVFSFDMSELFASTSSETEAFPSIAWSFDDDDDDSRSIQTEVSSDDASTCTNNSSLGKRKSITRLSRAKTNTHTNLNLLG